MARSGRKLTPLPFSAHLKSPSSLCEVNFDVVSHTDSVGEFHHRRFDEVDKPTIWIPQLGDRQTLVLGSRQDVQIVNQASCRERGIDVVKRRSGGGAVLVGAHDLVWIDVIMPREHPGWSEDVGRSFQWIGERLLAALAQLGAAGTVHSGPMVKTEWSDLICFAGLGPGEITVDGKKMAGISQRRTRHAARFQIAVLKRWDPAAMLELFDLEATRQHAGLDALADCAEALTAPSERIRQTLIDVINAD